VSGYAVGHRSPMDAGSDHVQTDSGTPLTPLAVTAQAKPSAAQSSFQPTAQPVLTDAPSLTGSDTAPAGASAETAVDVPVANSSGAGTSGESVVRTALPTQPGATPSIAGGSPRVEPALGQQPSIMVQIAAVSHAEDAEVLVGALRKRGYIVNARRDPTDGLLHVQVGPFANRSDAVAMRQKLLNDGYNAIVQ
ncbi:MAG TPA: SPOR domain-containing protein, partial [Rhizomicrobium sp.]|nr:SPOR domain-containing protein [Rhizomicrobium sp.]